MSECHICLAGEELSYELTFKKVKNINLRIRSDGTMAVSAPKYVGKKRVEDFLYSRTDWILATRSRLLQRAEDRKQKTFSLLSETVFEKALDEVYEQFRDYLPQKPTLVIRTMKSRWGSCIPSKGKITLNRLLLKAPEICVYYVMTHEMIHFIHPNHSKAFYEMFEQMMPDYRSYQKLLEAQNIL